MSLEPGKLLIIAGIVLVVAGLLFYAKIPFLGRLPGDIHLKRDGFTLYFPIVSSILLSILISAILYFFRK